MNRITNIITRVRDTLADSSGDRWSDDKLIRLIDDAQKDICRRAKLLRTKNQVIVKNNEGTINLPDDLLLLDRVLYKGTLLPFKSHLELDSNSTNWENDIGEPKYLVYDKQSKYQAKLYPIPTNLDLDTYIFTDGQYLEDINTLTDKLGFVSDIKEPNIEYIFKDSVYSQLITKTTNSVLADDFGFTDNIVTDLYTYEILNDYGVVTNITSDVNTGFYYKNNSDFGLLTDIIVNKNDVIEYIDSNRDFGIITDIDGVLLNSDYGVTDNYVGGTLITETDYDYGFISSVEGLTQNKNYGVVTSFSTDNISEEYHKNNLGLVTKISELDNLLTIYYFKTPDTIQSINSFLDIPEDYDLAIKYYVTSKALRDDMDTQNRDFGNEEFSFYKRELKEAIYDDSKDFTRNNTQYETVYNGAF